LFRHAFWLEKSCVEKLNWKSTLYAWCSSHLWGAKTQTLSPILVTLLSIPPFCRFRNVALLKDVFSFRFTSYKSKKFDVSVIQTKKKKTRRCNHMTKTWNGDFLSKRLLLFSRALPRVRTQHHHHGIASPRDWHLYLP
jgi:hypothetical protein